MPITPFHFGPGAFLHSVAPRQVSFLAFCAANVLIDLESLYNLVHGRFPVHAFFHTVIGASLVIAGVMLLFWACQRLTSRWTWANVFHWRSLTRRQVLVGATLGAYSHVVLDSIMHADLQPLSPFTPANPLLGAIPLGAWPAWHSACWPCS